jgi:hypothetical protein
MSLSQEFVKMSPATTSQVVLAKHQLHYRLCVNLQVALRFWISRYPAAAAEILESEDGFREAANGIDLKPQRKLVRSYDKVDGRLDVSRVRRR